MCCAFFGKSRQSRISSCLSRWLHFSKLLLVNGGELSVSSPGNRTWDKGSRWSVVAAVNRGREGN